MGMYAKLMSRITESSLMDETIPVRYTFVMLLAVADPKGYVVGTDVAIARRLNMPLEDFKRCIAGLMEPDPDSNSKEHDGRRVILSDAERGYFLVNYVKYRDTRDEEHRREYMRDYMRKRRGGNDVADVNSVSSSKPKEKKEGKAEGKGKEDGGSTEATPTSTDPMTADELIESFKEGESYRGIDIDREFSKMKEWLKTPTGKSRRLTKRFMVNWLNKCEPSLAVEPAQKEIWVVRPPLDYKAMAKEANDAALEKERATWLPE